MATTDMTFDEAVDNLQSMFERIDRELISTMLRANGGHMENTVTQLLELDTTTGEAGTDAAASSSAGPRRASPVSGGPLLDFGGGEAAAATAAAAAAPPAAPPVLRAASSSGSHVDPEAAAAVAAALGPEAAAAAAAAEESLYYPEDAAGGSDGYEEASAAAAGPPRPAGRASSSSSAKRWRNPLPDEFLAVPGRDLPRSPGAGPMADDEMVAQMFADELFVQQLAADPELAVYLDAEMDGSYVIGGDPYGEAQRRPARPRSSSTSRRNTGESFTTKMSTVGSEVKRKFNSFLLRFQRNRGGGGQAGYGGLQDADDDDDHEGASLLGGGRADGVELRDRTAHGGEEVGPQRAVIGTLTDDEDEADDAGARRRRSKDD